MVEIVKYMTIHMIETLFISILLAIWLFFGIVTYIEFMESNKWKLPTLLEYIISLIFIPLGLIGVSLYLTNKNA